MTARRRHSLADLLGPLESDIMDVVWERGEVTVREVHEVLRRDRNIAYTTVMTTLGRLADKRIVKRHETTSAHRFTPLVTRDDYARSTVKSVVDWLVSHFPDPAVAYFVDRVETDERALERLRRALDEHPGPDAEQ